MGRSKGQNEISIHPNYALVHCKHVDFIIDLQDISKVLDYKWFSKISNSTKQYYAYAHFSGNKKLLLHRYLMDCYSKDLVDHINSDTLDNRKDNLRIVSRLQNNLNTKKRKNCKSKYKGLTLRPSGRWGVYIKVGPKNICLGTYDLEIEEAKVYNKAALKYFGVYARINLI